MIFESHKEKKKRLLERNKRISIINMMEKEQRDSQKGLGAPEHDPEKSREHAREKKKEEETVWSARVHMVRDRLDGSKREADGRWNRFAGTESAGGRGR